MIGKYTGNKLIKGSNVEDSDKYKIYKYTVLTKKKNPDGVL